MKAILVEQTGDPSVLEYRQDLTDLQLDPSDPQQQLLIRNEYIGVNYIDTYHRDGSYPLPLPFIPGREAAGIVEQIADQFKVGDRVAYLGSGTYAEKTIVPCKHVLKLEDYGVSSIHGAALLLQGLTAAYLTLDAYKVSPRDRVLIPAAAGGTGSMIAQFCRALGATMVIGTVSSDAKAEMAMAHGCNHVIVYTRQNVHDEVMRITDGEGVHVVYDGVGQASFDTSLACLGRRGKFVSFGSASGHITGLDLQKLTKNSISLMRPALFDYIRTRAEFLTLADTVMTLYRDGKIKLTIYKDYPLADAALAHTDLQGKRTIGLIMLPEFPCELWQLRPIPEAVEDPDWVAKTVQACQFIESLGRRLNFPLRTVATAQAYFHVFFYEQQQRQGDAGFGGGESKRCQYPPMDIALTALLVASKAEETYKKIRAILSAAFLELNPSFSGTDVDVNIVEDHRKRIIQYEESLLVTIQFNFNLRHPFEEPLARICRYFDLSQEASLKALQILQQMYCSPIVIYYPTHCLIFAALLQLNPPPTGEEARWSMIRKKLISALRDPFGLELDDVEEAIKRFKPFRDQINC